MDAEDYEAESKTIEEKKADEEDMEVKSILNNILQSCNSY